MFSNREMKDKFYTKEEAVKRLLETVGDLSQYKYIIEPSAGNGSISKKLPKRTIAFDLYPEADNILKQDWFEFTFDKGDDKLAIIGNPPFGDRNILAKKFIKKAIELKADIIAFILTDTFRKPTYSSVAKDYKLTKIVKLPDTSFTLNKDDYHVPCSIFVWERNTSEKDLTWFPNTYTTKDFKFISVSEFNKKTDIRIKQAISKQMINPKKGKTYYIKPLTIDRESLISILSSIEYKGYSSVNGGVIALCQEEIIKLYLEKKKELENE